MTVTQIYSQSPVRNHLVSYLNALLESGEPFFLQKAGTELKRNTDLIMSALRRMEAAGILTLERRTMGSARKYRIVMTDGRQTPWSKDGEAAIRRLTHDEVMERRSRVEQERASHQRFWLDRERAPRWRDCKSERLLLDKATVLALQGINHG